MFFRRKNVRVSVRNKKVVVETKSGVNLYRFLVNERIISTTLCDGSGQCGKCKIKYIGNNIPKPTYKESLILAKINIEVGYRLACQHSIKKDIEIDTSEMLPSHLYPQNFDNNIIEPCNQDIKASKNDIPSNIKDEEESISINEFKPNINPTLIVADDEPSDGVLLVQLDRGIKYYCYSAALDNIISVGTVEHAENLRDIIDNNLISDFIHDMLKIKDIDRVIIILNKVDYESELLLDIIRYFKFDLGTLLCEVVMPNGDNNISRFYRLLHIDKGFKLTFSLDMLDIVYFATDKLIMALSYDKLEQPNLLKISNKSSNSIIDFDDNLNIVSVEKPGVVPDGIILPALLKYTKLLYNKGIIDSNFKLRNRSEITKSNVSLDIIVRIIGKDVPEGIYIYRDRFLELTLTQKDLDCLADIRNYINSVILYTNNKVGKINGLIFHTPVNYENLINLMFELGFIPKEFIDNTIYIPGDSTVEAINLFKEKNIHRFIEKQLYNYKNINLSSDKEFSSLREHKRL